MRFHREVMKENKVKEYMLKCFVTHIALKSFFLLDEEMLFLMTLGHCCSLTWISQFLGTSLSAQEMGFYCLPWRWARKKKPCVPEEKL